MVRLVVLVVDTSIVDGVWSKTLGVKLFSGINLTTQSPDGILLHFGQGHDSKYGDETIDATPENGVAVMDRGFCKLKRIKQLQENKNTFFVLI